MKRDAMDYDRPNMVTLCHTKVSPTINVGTMSLVLSHSRGYYHQVETWIFRQPDSSKSSTQIIHGTYPAGDKMPNSLRDRAIRAYNHIVHNLTKLEAGK